MRRETPASHQYIDYLLAKDRARPLYPEVGETDENDWVHELIARMSLTDDQMSFLDAIGAGHTVAGASRLVGKSPRWGRVTLHRIRRRAESYVSPGAKEG